MEYLYGNIGDAVAYLQQGLAIAEQLLRKEDEARIRHRLGLALWQHHDLAGARDQGWKLLSCSHCQDLGQ